LHLAALLRVILLDLDLAWRVIGVLTVVHAVPGALIANLAVIQLWGW